MNDQVTPQQFIVFLFALACGGVLACGYWYWAFGTGPVAWLLIVVRGVKRFVFWVVVVMFRAPADERTDRTDGPDGRVSEADLWVDRLELDKTRSAVMEILLTNEWTVTDMRREGIFRGENAAISAEVDAAKKRLGILDTPRQLRVRDDQGERLIPMEQ